MSKNLSLLSVVSLLACSSAFAQELSIYGIADAALRHTTTPVVPASSKAAVVGGGLSQSRLGFKASEDLGGGIQALAHLEHRFNLDNGQTDATAPLWQLAYVGVKTPYGRITLGRQYNVLFDVATAAYAPFRYSPYIEAFRPEVGFAFGSRQSDMVKYAVAAGGFAAELQVSLENGDTTSGTAKGVPYSFALPNKSRGGMVKYSAGTMAYGAGYMEVRDSASKKAKAVTLGSSYSEGALYLNASFTRNEFEQGFGSVTAPVAAIASAVQAQLLSTIVSSEFTGVASTLMHRRDLLTVGVTYNVTPEFNLGGQVWRIQQTGFVSAADGSANLAAVVADYALSKRTDVYAEVDRTVFDDEGAMAFYDGRKTRTGYMVGVRHRF